MIGAKVLVADVLPLFSQALGIALRLSSDLEVFDEYPRNGPQAAEAAKRLRPDVVLVDYWMPDLEGPDLARHIIAGLPNCRVIVLGWVFGPHHLRQAIEAGAVDVLPKDVRVEDVEDAIRRALAGQRWFYVRKMQEILDDRVREVSQERLRFAALTPREIEVLGLLNAGLSAAEIANRFTISIKTVRNHISALFAKTGAASQTEVLARARQCGFLRS